MMPPTEQILYTIYSLPSAFLMVLIVKRFLPVTKLWRHVVLLCSMIFATAPVIWLGDVANILLVAGVLFAAIPLLCGGRVLARVSVALLLFCVTISASAVFTSLRPPLDDYLHGFTVLLWLCIYFFVRYFVQPQQVRIIRTKRWLLLDVLALLPFGVTFVIVVFTQPTRTYVTADEHTDTLVIGNEGVLLTLLVLASVYSVGLLLYVALLARQERLEQREMLWTIRQQHYASLEENQLQVRRLRHDMANHLTAMAGMEDAAMRRYLAQLSTTPAMTGGRRFCENEVVNAVLSSKMPVIEQQGIQAEIKVEVPKALPISDIDLCAVFSNCLDNAIEACQKCPADSRMLRLDVKTEKGVFALRLKNSMAGSLAADEGRLITSKQDKENHGLGVAEIQDIVWQHNGLLQFEQQADIFTMQLSMVLQSASQN